MTHLEGKPNGRKKNRGKEGRMALRTLDDGGKKTTAVLVCIHTRKRLPITGKKSGKRKGGKRKQPVPARFIGRKERTRKNERRR